MPSAYTRSSRFSGPTEPAMSQKENFSGTPSGGLSLPLVRGEADPDPLSQDETRPATKETHMTRSSTLRSNLIATAIASVVCMIAVPNLADATGFYTQWNGIHKSHDGFGVDVDAEAGAGAAESGTVCSNLIQAITNLCQSVYGGMGSAYVDACIANNSDIDACTVDSLYASAGAYVDSSVKLMGKTKDFLDISLFAKNSLGDLSAGISIDIAGIEVYGEDVDQDELADFEIYSLLIPVIGKSVSKTYDVSVIDVTVDAGAGGFVNFDLSGSLTGHAASITATPSLIIGAWASAGFDSCCASAGVDLDITVFELGTPATGSLEWDNQLNFVAGASLGGVWEALSGSMDVWAELMGASGSVELFSYSGFGGSINIPVASYSFSL